MEWGTVVVFTCSKAGYERTASRVQDCPCEDPVEEFLVIQAAE